MPKDCSGNGPTALRSDGVVHRVGREVQLTRPHDDAILYRGLREHSSITQRGENAGVRAKDESREVNFSLSAIQPTSRFRPVRHAEEIHAAR